MNPIRSLMRGALAAAVLCLCPSAPAAPEPMEDDNPLHGSLQWRCIGPARGGRVQAVSGVIGEPNTYYMGATGGGVFKTTDAGGSWRNITDGWVESGSVGGIAVAPSDPNVIYVGMGEADIRGNFSRGDGVYKSTDAGKTWKHLGLEDTKQIGRVIVHREDPDVAFVAALGHVFGPNAQRGVFRTTDGGETWEKVLYVDDETGAIDVRMDPFNPRVVYAGMWQVKRSPWSLWSGGEGSGLYRSTDGGETWEELTEGLPADIKGKVGVSPSPARRDLVYAIIEAEDGGVFRSDDAGETWRRVNSEAKLRQRAWYYTHIYADPSEAETVYVMNVRFHKSVDGGESWDSIRVPHVDNHDLWIDPNNSDRMINANDGGANVTFDGGETWSTQTNQPTAQFYRVTTDNGFPYRVYGAQQDNSTASVSSQLRVESNWQRDLYSVGGCECGYIAVHPDNTDIVYAGCYGGNMTIYDHEKGETRNISVWPENPMGSGADALRHRFQWTFPIVISPHDPEKVYVGGERVFVTTDRGASYRAISPDLTTNDKTKQGPSGGPITKDNTAVEYYCTIFTIAESPLMEGRIWTGSDDGLIHVTDDGGETWEDVTPPDMGDWPLISLIEASPHDPDTAYAAVTRYKMDDDRPYVYRTTDRGETWELLVRGIAEDDFVRSIREDPIVPGLLYIGTESGVYYSLNNGRRWHELRMNLPHVPVTDVAVKNDDLVIATQGRSFWIMDDLAVLRQIAEEKHGEFEPAMFEPAMFEPAAAYRERWDGVRVHYHLPEAATGPITMAFSNEQGNELRAYDIELEKPDDEDDAAGGDEQAEEEPDEQPGELPEDPGEDRDSITAEPGMNVFEWNMRLEDPTKVPGAVAWPPHPPGPRVPPGAYRVTLTVAGEPGGNGSAAEPTWKQTRSFEILPDPRYNTTPDQYAEQYDLLLEIHGALDEAHTAVNEIRDVRAQINAALERAEKAGRSEPVAGAADDLLEKLSEIENTIIQTKSKSRQDPLNHPIKINDKIGALAYGVSGDHAPTAQHRAVFEDLNGRLQEQLDRFERVRSDDVPAFNRLVAEQQVPAIAIERDAKPETDQPEPAASGAGG